MGRKKKWTKERLVQVYGEACEEEGHLIRLKEMKRRDDLPTPWVMYKYFDSVKELRVEAGVDVPKAEPDKRGEISLVKKYEKMCRDCMFFPKSCEYDAEDCYQQTTDDYWELMEVD